MKTACVLTVLIASISYALPTEIKRTPILGLLEDKPNSIGKDPLTMVKALPDHNIDPSPLGIDNTIAGLGLPELDMKRSLGGLDGLMGMTGFSRNNPLGPAVEERPGETKPVFHSFIPLDEMKSPVMPGAKHKGSSMVNEDEIKSVVPLLSAGQLGTLFDSIPDTPLGSVVKSLPVEKIVKRMEKRSRKYLERQWSGAEELNDYNDEPYFG